MPNIRCIVLPLCLAIGSVACQRGSTAEPRVLGEAKLIAKSDKYFLHLFPKPEPDPMEKEDLAELFDPSAKLKKHFGVPIENWLLTHTALKTGKVRYLFISGHHTVSGIPMGHTLQHFREWRLLGVSATDDRIFLLTWRSAQLTIGEGPAHPVVGKGEYFLTAFSTADGTKLASTMLQGDRLANEPPPQTHKPTHLQFEGDRITVFGQTLRLVDGKRFHTD